MTNWSGTQTIRTPRLILRRFELSDAHAMYTNWATDEKTVKFLSWDIHESENLTRALLSQWIENYKSSEYYNWAIEYEGEAIGNISVVRQSKTYYGFKELGYCLGSHWWNLGLMSEAVSAVCDYFFLETDTHRLVIRHAVDNSGSGRVAEKCGFTREGIEREAYISRDGHYCNLRVNSLLRHEWERMGTKDRVVLETERLILRPLCMDDAEDVFEYASDPEVTKYMFFGGSKDIRETKRYLKKCECKWSQKFPDEFTFALILRDTGKLIGASSITFENGTVELGWVLSRNFHKQGFAAEAGCAMIQHVFNHSDYTRIIARCDAENYGSWRVMEKLGMVREAVYRNARPNGHNELEYAILREEWEAQNAQAR